MTQREHNTTQGAHELRVVERALKRCKWYHLTKRKTLQAHRDLIKIIYEL